MFTKFREFIWFGSLALLGCGGQEPTNPNAAGGTAPLSAGDAGTSGHAATAGALCSVCAHASDCTDGACLVSNQTGERFCGRDCSSANGCPRGYECARVQGADEGQCVPSSKTCAVGDVTAVGGSSTGAPSTGGGGSTASGGTPSGGTATTVPGPTAAECDPGFLGPFCEGVALIGFERGPEIENPTLAQVQEFSVQALNYIRSLTCLPPLALDSCLGTIGAAALAANDNLGIHGHFKESCMNAAHKFGNSCECGWSQENYGAASGSSRTWKDGVIVPLCGMMEEPKGVGHRSNIEHKEWTRVGVGVDYTARGASWYHEFGR